MNYKDVNDNEMLYLIGEKDEEAEKILFGKYRNLIMKLAPKYLPSIQYRGGDFDDLVQEGYIGLYSAIKNYHPENNTLFYTFASVCIERQMATYCKRLSTNKQEILNYSYSLDIIPEDARDSFIETIPGDKDDEPLQCVMMADYVEAIVDFKNKLSNDMACVFELRMNGFTYREISTLLDLPKSRIDSALCQIRTKLKQENIRTELFSL